MLRHAGLAIVLLAMFAIAPPKAHASEPRGCITYEDDSFVCGTLEPDDVNGVYWGIDRDKPFVTGCIPGGECDTSYTDDCPASLEDVECWNATQP